MGGEGSGGWSREGENEEHGVEMGQSDGAVLSCTICCLKQQGRGSGQSGSGVVLQSHVMKAVCVSDCGIAVPCDEGCLCIRLWYCSPV